MILPGNEQKFWNTIRIKKELKVRTVQKKVRLTSLNRRVDRFWWNIVFEAEIKRSRSSLKKAAHEPLRGWSRIAAWNRLLFQASPNHHRGVGWLSHCCMHHLKRPVLKSLPETSLGTSRSRLHRVSKHVHPDHVSKSFTRFGYHSWTNWGFSTIVLMAWLV